MARLKSIRFSQRLLFILPGAALAVILSVFVGVNMHQDYKVANQAVANTSVGLKLQQTDTQADAAKAAPVTPPISDSTPPPINRPGNRYVDENSAGPEKLTYNERQTLTISPAVLTVYTSQGAPLVGDQAMMVIGRIQITSSDGKPFGFPQATGAGNTIFSVRSIDIPMSTAPTYYALWPMSAESTRATPGTYNVTFTAWSSDRQIRYTGSFQLNVVPLPGM